MSDTAFFVYFQFRMQLTLEESDSDKLEIKLRDSVGSSFNPTGNITVEVDNGSGWTQVFNGSGTAVSIPDVDDYDDNTWRWARLTISNGNISDINGIHGLEFLNNVDTSG